MDMLIEIYRNTLLWGKWGKTINSGMEAWFAAIEFYILCFGCNQKTNVNFKICDNFLFWSPWKIFCITKLCKRSKLDHHGDLIRDLLWKLSERRCILFSTHQSVRRDTQGGQALYLTISFYHRCILHKLLILLKLVL